MLNASPSRPSVPAVQLEQNPQRRMAGEEEEFPPSQSANCLLGMVLLAAGPEVGYLEPSMCDIVSNDSTMINQCRYRATPE